MKNNFIYFFFLMLTACANPFGDAPSKVEAGYGPESQVQGFTTIEPVSASLNQASSSMNRRVDVSVGSKTDQITFKTNQNRTVFLSVQGQIISQ